MRVICKGLAAAFAVACLSACALVGFAPNARAASAAQIDDMVSTTLDEFFHQVQGSRELVAKSSGALVFPRVIKAGFGVGGEYGEGALVKRGKAVEYFSTISASFGFQVGVQTRSVIIIFMSPEALGAFQRVDGWKVGVDGSVALLTVGLGASIDSTRVTNPIVGFIFDTKGLMYNLTLEGSKISRIWRN
jgi:lipid-binding SYLF domain-containing protein